MMRPSVGVELELILNEETIMTKSLSFRTKWSASLVASALMVASATASAQTQPGPVTGEPTVTPTPSPAPPVEEPKPAVTYPKMAGSGTMIMMGPESWVRFGFQIQSWTTYIQSTTKAPSGSDGGYSLDFYLRRARFFAAVQFFKDVNAFILFDSPNLGRSTQTGAGTAESPFVVSRNFTPAIVQDAFGEVKFAGDAFMLEAGLMVWPFSHNGLQSTTSYLGLDVSQSVVNGAGTNTSVLRDTGLQLKGYELDDKLEFRLFVGAGLRQAAHGDAPLAHNGPRVTLHLQYQFFEPDVKGYVYTGQSFGRRKLLGVSAGFDYQSAENVDKPMINFSVGVFGDWPLSGESDIKNGGDELAFVAEFYHYDGGARPGSTPPGTGTYPVTVLPRQNDVYAEVSYYNKELKLGAFGKFEGFWFTDTGVDANNRIQIAGGLKYFVHEVFANFVLQYQRIQFTNLPATTTTNNSNQITLQAQLFYY